MKIKGIALILLALLLTASCALAQQLPGVDVFSPGLVRLSEKMAEEPAVHMEASLSAQDAFYVRDLSVLSAMLEGTTFVYDSAMGNAGRVESFSVLREGETLFSGVMAGDTAAVNGKAAAIGKVPDARMQTAMEFLDQTPLLERAPLAAVEAFLLSLEQGEPLFGDYAVVQPFESVRTMSDDGTRLTRINITGSIVKEGELPWVIQGYLKQPAGRAPKDTFELTATQDEGNFLELSYSSLRQSEITKKNKAGKNSVDTNLKIAGKIGGYRISERLTVYLRNTWTADGENLSEKIVVNASLSHQDSTPGREMQRMNQAEGKMRHEIRLTTAESGNDVFELTDAITLSLVMDENTVLDAGAQAAITVGAQASEIAMPDVQEQATVESLVQNAAADMARRIYRQLGDGTREKILGGLENQQEIH